MSLESSFVLHWVLKKRARGATYLRRTYQLLDKLSHLMPWSPSRLWIFIMTLIYEARLPSCKACFTSYLFRLWSSGSPGPRKNYKFCVFFLCAIYGKVVAEIANIYFRSTKGLVLSVDLFDDRFNQRVYQKRVCFLQVRSSRPKGVHLSMF